MTRLATKFAEALLDHAARVMPARRADWAQGMRAEADHLPPRERLSFAIGCVRSSYRLRLTDADSLVWAGRWTIILGLVAAGAVCLRAAMVIRPHDSSAMILVLGLICLAAAFAFGRWGLDRLPMLAAAGFAGALVAVALLGDITSLFSGAVPGGRFYRAILVEQAVGWAALFGLAHLLLALDARRSIPD
jgi:hypothetical protein